MKLQRPHSHTWTRYQWWGEKKAFKQAETLDQNPALVSASTAIHKSGMFLLPPFCWLYKCNWSHLGALYVSILTSTENWGSSLRASLWQGRAWFTQCVTWLSTPYSLWVTPCAPSLLCFARERCETPVSHCVTVTAHIFLSVYCLCMWVCVTMAIVE